MVKGNQEVRPAVEDTDSSSSSSSSQGQRSLPVTAVKKAANRKNPTESTKAMDSGFDSDDSDSDVPPKPFASKAMDDGAKLKKPRSKPNSKTPAKRSAAIGVENASKKVKEKGDDEGKKSVLFQRLWSDDDEIAILKGMIDYKEKKGADPMADSTGFHDFVKKSLHVDVDRRQLMDKVRRLRKRYHNSVGNKKGFRSHEKAAFELSEEIWGHKVAKKVSKPSIISRSKESKGVENCGSGEERSGGSWQFVGKASISMGLDENIVKLGLELCRKDRKAEIEEKWRRLHLEESDLFSRKLDLAREESKMITEAFRSERK